MSDYCYRCGETEFNTGGQCAKCPPLPIFEDKDEHIAALEKELADTKAKYETGLREIEQHVPPEARKVHRIITKLLEG